MHCFLQAVVGRLGLVEIEFRNFFFHPFSFFIKLLTLNTTFNHVQQLIHLLL